MSIPDVWPLVPVTGTYVMTDGTPAVGVIVFSPSQPLVVDGMTVFPTAFVARLDDAGAFALELPATDDPHLSNRDWVYRVREVVRGGRCYDITVPYGSAGIDLAAIAPAVAPDVAMQLADVARSGNAADLVGIHDIVDAAVAAAPASGLTNAAADARYVQLAQINAAGGVAGLDVNARVAEARLPLPPVDLVLLFENQLA